MIKNLLFDLGGVIMDIERDRAVEALVNLGMPNADEMLGVYEQKGPFLQLERGDITERQFLDILRPMFTRLVSDDEIARAFDSFLIGIPLNRLRDLERLRRHYSIFLLSNTNPMMWRRRILDEFRKDGHDIDHYFDGLVTSFEVKAYKPDAAIFRAAERICGIKPEETLFLDDSQANVDAARALGFHATLVRPGTDFIDLLPDTE